MGDGNDPAKALIKTADMADGHVGNDELIAGMFTEVKVTDSDGAGER
ncbi:hypothetical protein [Streptomyces prunicolor]|jgi:hypothetical protein|nr:hypothetical protein [Streptomyces prunicolor]